jgi:hypothetical protein
MLSSGILRHLALKRTDISEESILRSVHRLLIAANVVPSASILLTLKIEAIRFYKISVLTRATRRNIPEEDILHSHSLKNSNLL